MDLPNLAKINHNITHESLISSHKNALAPTQGVLDRVNSTKTPSPPKNESDTANCLLSGPASRAENGTSIKKGVERESDASTETDLHRPKLRNKYLLMRNGLVHHQCMQLFYKKSTAESLDETYEYDSERTEDEVEWVEVAADGF